MGANFLEKLEKLLEKNSVVLNFVAIRSSLGMRLVEKLMTSRGSIKPDGALQ